VVAAAVAVGLRRGLFCPQVRCRICSIVLRRMVVRVVWHQLRVRLER
jgi:hypothetical protein